MSTSKKEKLAWDEFRRAFKFYPDVIPTLERKLKERGETLDGIVQIHGDHLHYPILIKGATYFYGIWTRDREGNISQLTKVCDYIGTGHKFKRIKFSS